MRTQACPESYQPIRRRPNIKLLVFLVLLLTCIGLGFRLYQADDKSLWSDEICTIASALGNAIDPNAVAQFDPMSPQPASAYLAKANTPHGFLAVGKTIEVLKSNIHPPFFFWLINPVLYALGSSPLALRLLPILFGTACIPMIFLVGRRLGGNATGLLAAAMMAVSGYQIAHAQDARQYTLITFLALTSVWLLFRILQSSFSSPPRSTWREWSALTLLSAIGLYTQYFYGLFYVFLLIFAVIQGWGHRDFLTKLGLSAAGTAVLFAPWLWVLREQLGFLKAEGHYTNGLWDPIQLPEILFRTSADFIFPQEVAGKILFGIILALMVFFAVRDKQRLSSWKSFSRYGPVTFLLVWLGVIFGGQILLDMVKDSHTLSIRRYTLLAAPAVYLLVAYTLTRMRLFLPSLKPILACALLALMVTNSVQVLQGKKLRSDNFRAAAHWINPRLQDRDVVLVHKSGAIAVGVAYYLKPEARMMGVMADDGKTMEASPRMTTRIDNALASSNRVWVVLSHSGKPMARLLDSQLREHGFLPREERKFPGVQLLRYDH